MIRSILTLIVGMTIFAAPARSETPSLDWLVGEWVGTGTMMGQPSEVSLSIAPALGGTATALSYRATIKGPEGKSSRFEAMATWRAKPGGRVEGQWSDTNGSFHKIGGRITASSMTVIWGDPVTELGRSTYERDPAGRLKIVDSVLAPDGTWRVFAMATYTSRPPR